MNHSFVTIPLDPAPRDTTDETSFVVRPAGERGVGVYTTHGIRKGVHLRLFPDGRTRIIPPEQLAADPRLAQLCEFYGVATAKGMSLAPDLGCMSIGWYLNHADAANAHHDDAFEYYASRDIDAGEEITIDYRLL